MLNLHLGCGNKYIPGFTHVDIRKFPHVDIVSSADDLNMFKDGTVDLIYACHLLEHFGRRQLSEVLKEWFRVLRPSGILRLAVPDFKAIVDAYAQYPLEKLLGLLVGGQTYEYNFHKCVFDFKYLESVLKTVGFTAVYRYDWKNTSHKDYDDLSQAYLPHMDKKNGRLMSLNIEAVK